MATYTAHEILGGVSEKTVKMTVDRRLRYAPYSQAGWDDYSLHAAKEYISAFYSYSSRIFKACYKLCDGCKPQLYAIDAKDANAASNYSRTTSRQCMAALRELGLCDKDIRGIKRYLDRGGKCAVLNGGLWVDAFTGEVIA